MKFDDASLVESVAWQLRYGDLSRGQNRARINSIFNGAPPFSQEEVDQNNINVNVNFLESTTLSHDARSQFAAAFQKPGNYFRCSTDMGPLHKRNERAVVVTKAVNRIMKRSLNYYETMRSKFASLVLHGIAPASWDNSDSWCPIDMGVEDLLVPSDTRLSFINLPFFIKLRAYTAPELIKLTKGQKRDKGWNMKLVDACIKWVDKESQTLLGSNFPDIWSPEKMAERLKGDGGYYMGDRVPTINVFDFWYWSDEGNNGGWRRRMVLDTWSSPTGVAPDMRSNQTLDFAKGEWLYNSGDVVKATSREQIFSCQFADLSSVAPFRYHSVRSLGFLLYAVCHLQNRLRCRLTETTFEQLMMLFRVKSQEDVQRVLKVDLYNRGFIDESVQFVPAAERFQPNTQLAEFGVSQITDLIQRHSSSFTSMPQNGASDVEKTKFQVQAETQTATAMVSIALQQAYTYQTFEYKEIFRRFCKSNSRDPDVIRFQAECLRGGVPKSYLEPTAWDIEPERVMGAGNKTLEMSIAQQLMQYRNLYDPAPQRQILRDVTLAITDDPARAEQLVPENPVTITDAVHDAQLAAGTLMQGLPVALKTGINHVEYVDTMMATMAHIIQGAQQQGGMTDIKTIQGLQNMANNVAQHIQIIAQDPAEKQRVKQYGDQLGKMMNLVKAMAQRLVEQMKKQQGQGQQGDPQAQAKMQATIIQAQTKAKLSSQSHAQRTAQRQIQFEQQIKQDQQRHELELKVKAAEAGIDLTQQRLKMLNGEHKESTEE
jgi:hypothetical protein